MLLVDDEESILVLMGQVLAPFCRIITARDLQGAKTALETHPVRVIVCDHVLPDGLGLDYLQDLHRRRATPVRVLVTGHSQEGLAIAALNSGALFRYLAKPFDLMVFRHTVQDALRQHEREDEVRHAVRHYERAAAEGLPHPRLGRTLHFVGLFLLGAAILLAGLAVLAALALLVLYWLKSFLGIDVFSGSHLSDWL